MSDPFYVVGTYYKLLGYKEPLFLYEIDETYAKFMWMGDLKYFVINTRRHPHMYKKVS